ncbi:MAG: FtsX-like permease family protein, partial [Desulfatitalea sp.]
LARALDWPVRITTRREQLGRQLDDIGRRTGLTLVGFVPALLALALVVAAVGTGGYRRRWEMGLLKALGWSGGDILRLHVYRGLLVAGPAVAVGAAGAYLLLFAPGITWVARWIFGWSGPAPAFYLSCQGAAGGLLLAALLVGLPFLAAVFWTGWQAAIRPPAECIAEER